MLYAHLSLDSGSLSSGVIPQATLETWRHPALARLPCADPRRRALVVKRRAAAIGLDPARVAGHSLRAGLATSAAAAGASERAIANQTGHRSLAVLRRYIRSGELFRDNAAAAVGL